MSHTWMHTSHKHITHTSHTHTSHTQMHTHAHVTHISHTDTHTSHTQTQTHISHTHRHTHITNKYRHTYHTDTYITHKHRHTHITHTDIHTSHTHIIYITHRYTSHTQMHTYTHTLTHWKALHLSNASWSCNPGKWLRGVGTIYKTPHRRTTKAHQWWMKCKSLKFTSKKICAWFNLVSELVSTAKGVSSPAQWVSSGNKLNGSCCWRTPPSLFSTWASLCSSCFLLLW
jgi:hypothetical protein